MSARRRQGRDSDRGADRAPSARSRAAPPRRGRRSPTSSSRADVDMAARWRCATRSAARSPRSSCGPARSRSRAVPRANGAYRDGRFELYSRVNIGLVVADERSYLIPTVFDADRKSLAELTDEIERVTEAARAGELEPPAYAGATFTLSYVGALGVPASTIVVNSPQAAALAAGAIRPAPVVRDGDARIPAPDGDHARLRSPDPLRRQRGTVPDSRSPARSAPRTCRPRAAKRAQSPDMGPAASSRPRRPVAVGRGRRASARRDRRDAS